MKIESSHLFNRWSVFSIFLTSVVVIALQLVLLRTLSVTHYYHFTYLVVSTALLGFGASGTILALCFDRLQRNFPFWNLFFLFLFLLTTPLAYLAAQSLPLDTHYLLYSRNQVLLLVLYNLLIFVPFLFGGLVIGFMLTFFKRKVPVLYGANLIGSGAGGLVALGLMTLFPAYQLPFMIAPVTLLAMACFIRSTGLRSRLYTTQAVIMVTIGVLITLVSLTFDPPDAVDPYKSLSHFRQMEEQGDARLVAGRYGPRAQIDVYESPTFHYTLFAGPQAMSMPPPQLALLLDGHIAAPLFSIVDAADAVILDYTPQSLPYRLLNTPRVLLLGEVSGVNIWLARRMGASAITVVQTNPQLLGLLMDDLADQGGHVFHGEDVEVIQEDPRLYLERNESRYDLIQFVSGEATATGTGGLQGLNEDYLLTAEAVVRSLGLLSPEGLITITRGIQSPPRDNLKIASMFVEAARLTGMTDPAEHLLVSRNYLAANSILSRSPMDSRRIGRFLEAAGGLQLDLEHYHGIRTDEIDQINRIDGPEGKGYSYIHHAVNRILSNDPDSFYREWAYQIRSPLDDSPYFHDFFKWGSLGLFIDSYGSQWFQRLELGYVILLITSVQLAVIAFLLILLPLLLRRSSYRGVKNRLPTLLHFFMIGLGFMFLEITFIQTFTKFLGDPVFSATAVICSILIFSGLGSTLQDRFGVSAVRRIRTAVTIITVLSLLYILYSDVILDMFIEAAIVPRFLVTIMMLAPISFFLGWMFPGGMEMLERRSDQLMPWAWGINGFASVTAAPVAIILSMSIGFHGVILLGIGCYLIAGGASWLWR